MQKCIVVKRCRAVRLPIKKTNRSILIGYIKHMPSSDSSFVDSYYTSHSIPSI